MESRIGCAGRFVGQLGAEAPACLAIGRRPSGQDGACCQPRDARRRGLGSIAQRAPCAATRRVSHASGGRRALCQASGRAGRPVGRRLRLATTTGPVDVQESSVGNSAGSGRSVTSRS